MRKLFLFLSLSAALSLGPGCPAPAGEAPIRVSKIYLDSNSDKAPDSNVSIIPTGTNPATDGLDITAPGGVNVTAGALTVEAGGLAVTGGNATVTNTANGEASITIKNLSAGSSASIALIMQRALSGGTIRAMEWLGASHSSGDGGLRINIPETQQVEIYSTSGSAALAWVDDTDGFVAPTVTAQDQVIIEGLGSTSAPAIWFTGTLATDTGVRIDSSGKAYYRTNSVDAITVSTSYVATPGYFSVTNGAGTIFEIDGFTADVSGLAPGLHFVPAGPYWEMTDYPLRSPGVTLTQRTATLESDDETVSVDSPYASYMVLSSDSATAADRTFTLSPGSGAGHRLLLQFDSTGSGACQMEDGAAISGGALRLTDDWTPAGDETLSLIFDGADWIETGRTVQ